MILLFLLLILLLCGIGLFFKVLWWMIVIAGVLILIGVLSYRYNRSSHWRR